MFRWIRTLAKRFALYLRGRFASRRQCGQQLQRPKVRLPRRTVKPSLEGLGERVMPSATPFPGSSLTPDTSSTANQLTQLGTVVQNEVSSIKAAISQEVAQVMGYVLQRWENLLGVEPTTPSQPPAGSGMGSGSGTVMTAHNASNQQAKASVPQPGSGTGSGANSNVQEAASMRMIGGITSKQGVTPLVGSGSGSAPPDDYTWAPGTGIGSSGSAMNYLFSNPENWLFNGVAQTPNGPTHYVPGHRPTDAAIFDGYFNSQCIVDMSTGEDAIVLQNGYTGSIEIQGNGDALNIPDYEDDDFGVDDFKVVFLAPDSQMNVDARTNEVIRPGNWNIGAGGVVNVSGLTVYEFGIGAGLQQSSASPINVNGELIFGDGNNSGKYSTFHLTNAAANLTVEPQGSISFYQTGDTLIDSPANSGVVISNSGIVTLQGVAGAGQTDITVPLQNHSVFNVNGGNWFFNETDTTNNDLSMNAGSINMTGNAQISCGSEWR